MIALIVRIGSRQLGLGRVPCVRIEHLNETEKRVLRLGANRLGEKGEWNLEELKIEFEELIFAEAPIEVSGFTFDVIDHIVLDGADDAIEEGPLVPEAGATAVARVGDVFDLGPHRIICGSSTDPETLRQLTAGDPLARLVLTDEPYKVPIAGHVTGGRHREFAMASGEMTDAEFLAFNEAWMAAILPCLCDGGVFGTFIDWRGYPTVYSAAVKLGLKPINLVVWAKTNAGMGSLYRSQHELLPLFKNGSAPHINNIELGNDHIDIERIDAAADPAGLLSGHESGPGAEEGVDDDVGPVGQVQQRILEHRRRFYSRVVPQARVARRSQARKAPG